MQVGTYKFHRRAFTALNQLADDEQAQVQETLTRLANTPAVQWRPSQAKKLPGEPPLYLVRINDSLRAIVQATDGQEPEVMDIVRRETLETFANSAGSADR